MRHGHIRSEEAGKSLGALIFAAFSVGLFPVTRAYLMKRGMSPYQASIVAAIPTVVGAAAGISILRRRAR